MMKTIMFFVLFLICTTSFSADTSSLKSNFKSVDSKYLKENVKSVINDIEKFSEVEKLTESDLASTVSVLKTLVMLDSYDKSRTAPQMLAASYDKNKNIYQLAFKKLTKTEKKEVKEMFDMLERLNSSGQD